MIPGRYEYLFLLLIFGLIGLAILSARAQRAIRTQTFWVSMAIFCVFGTAVDLLAIHWNWWQWSPDKTCGIRLLAIPIEEYILFLVGHTAAVAIWETLDDLA
ncbi:MAG: lycopene cyclase domain-containing protein [Thermoanaerobaculia bacterium]